MHASDGERAAAPAGAPRKPNRPKVSMKTCINGTKTTVSSARGQGMNASIGMLLDISIVRWVGRCIWFVGAAPSPVLLARNGSPGTWGSVSPLRGTLKPRHSHHTLSRRRVAPFLESACFGAVRGAAWCNQRPTISPFDFIDGTQQQATAHLRTPRQTAAKAPDQTSCLLTAPASGPGSGRNAWLPTLDCGQPTPMPRAASDDELATSASSQPRLCIWVGESGYFVSLHRRSSSVSWMHERACFSSTDCCICDASWIDSVG